jgi:membrane protease subunit HflK
MPWNKPGSSDPSPQNEKDKDPWTGKPKSTTPPNLEEMLKKFYQKGLQQLTGKKSGGSQGNGGSTPESNFNFPGIGLGIILATLFLIWFIWGIFIINPAEQGVILRFGRYVGSVGPGPHWAPPFIEEVFRVNEQKISTYSYDAEMLTKDENIVSVAVAVQYRIKDARAYLFGVVKPQDSLQQATASALRQVIGQTNLNQVLTSGREQIRQQVQGQITKILSRYNTGLVITDVAMQPAKAPEEVKEAFDDAIKAQEDEQRYENQAQAYAMQVEPIAKGQAQRLLADAKAYQQQVVLHASADVAPFLALLPEYKKSPQVMRERMYLETLEHVLSDNNKILVDTQGSGNNMFYLPLDKLLASTNKTSAPPITPLAPAVDTATLTAPVAVPLSNTATPANSNTAPQGGY